MNLFSKTLCSKEFYFSCIMSCAIGTLEAETEGLLANVHVGCKTSSRCIEILKQDLVSTKDWACVLVVEKKKKKTIGVTASTLHTNRK